MAMHKLFTVNHLLSSSSVLKSIQVI